MQIIRRSRKGRISSILFSELLYCFSFPNTYFHFFIKRERVWGLAKMRARGETRADWECMDGLMNRSEWNSSVTIISICITSLVSLSLYEEEVREGKRRKITWIQNWGRDIEWMTSSLNSSKVFTHSIQWA